jgi:DNA-binding LacI/PurR family transcriptional regulator
MAITLGRLDEDQRELLARARIPSVETDTGHDPDAADTGAALQVRYLASRGHRRLGYLTTADPKLGMFARPRLAGVRSACAGLGLDPPAVAELAALPDVPVGDLSAALRAWARRPDPVTAVACYNDLYAVACVAAASRAGLSVPGELAVIGMDDQAVSAYTLPALTTIRLHVIDFARHLWTRASAVLDGRPAPERASSMLFSLVQRQSA